MARAKVAIVVRGALRAKALDTQLVNVLALAVTCVLAHVAAVIVSLRVVTSATASKGKGKRYPSQGVILNELPPSF